MHTPQRTSILGVMCGALLQCSADKAAIRPGNKDPGADAALQEDRTRADAGAAVAAQDAGATKGLTPIRTGTPADAAAADAGKAETTADAGPQAPDAAAADAAAGSGNAGGTGGNAGHEPAAGSGGNEAPEPPCANAPCANDGRCEVEGHGYRCVCPPGYAGPRCERAVEACRLSANSCAADEYCNFSDTGNCGTADAAGSCEPIPKACVDVELPVCGCDARDYLNACRAAQAGVSVARAGKC